MLASTCCNNKQLLSARFVGSVNDRDISVTALFRIALNKRGGALRSLGDHVGLVVVAREGWRARHGEAGNLLRLLEPQHILVPKAVVGERDLLQVVRLLQCGAEKLKTFVVAFAHSLRKSAEARVAEGDGAESAKHL